MYRSKLDKVLEEKKIKQITLARHFNVSKQVVNNWVRGYSKPRFGMLEDVAKYLNMEFKDLWL